MDSKIKNIKQCKSLPFDITDALEQYVIYERFATEMYNDINTRFDFPVLSAAMEKLVKFIKCREAAFAVMEANGFSTDDAFKYDELTSEEDAE
jgi:hypothetical protein